MPAALWPGTISGLLNSLRSRQYTSMRRVQVKSPGQHLKSDKPQIAYDPLGPTNTSSGVIGNHFVEAPAIFKRQGIYYALFGARRTSGTIILFTSIVFCACCVLPTEVDVAIVIRGVLLLLWPWVWYWSVHSFSSAWPMDVSRIV